MPGGIHPPPEVIASWPKPNYAHPETRGPTVIIVEAVLAGVAIVVVTMRLWSRLAITHNFGIDDWMLLASLLPTIGLCVTIGLATEMYNFNKHVWDIPIPELATTRKVSFAIEIQYVVAIGLIRISILLFYKRLTKGILPQNFIYALWACMAFVIAFMIIFIVTPFAACTPFSAWWNQIDPRWTAVHSYRCNSDMGNLFAASVVSTVQDFLVAGMPTLLFWRMKIPFRQKVALGAVFAVGFVLCFTAIVRFIFSYRVYFASYDVTWEAYYGWLFTSIEVLLGCIVASAPALKVFFRRYLLTRFTYYYDDNNYGAGGTRTEGSFNRSLSGTTAEGAHNVANKRPHSFPQRISRLFSGVSSSPSEQRHWDEKRNHKGPSSDPESSSVARTDAQQSSRFSTPLKSLCEAGDRGGSGRVNEEEPSALRMGGPYDDISLNPEMWIGQAITSSSPSPPPGEDMNGRTSSDRDEPGPHNSETWFHAKDGTQGHSWSRAEGTSNNVSAYSMSGAATTRTTVSGDRKTDGNIREAPNTSYSGETVGKPSPASFGTTGEREHRDVTEAFSEPIYRSWVEGMPPHSVPSRRAR